jgi:hypothetical protein
MISSRSSSPFKSLECGICLSPKDDNAVNNDLLFYTTITPCCKNDVHLLCLKIWLKQKVSCPFCRKENMYSKEGKLLSMKKLYIDHKKPFPSDDQLIHDFDDIIPNYEIRIQLIDYREETSNRVVGISYQAITLILILALGIIYLSTLLFPLYQS